MQWKLNSSPGIVSSKGWLVSFLFTCCLTLCEAFGTLNVTGFCLQESSFA